MSILTHTHTHTLSLISGCSLRAMFVCLCVVKRKTKHSTPPAAAESLFNNCQPETEIQNLTLQSKLAVLPSYQKEKMKYLNLQFYKNTYSVRKRST